MNLKNLIMLLLFLSLNNLYSQNVLTENKLKQINSTATSKLNKLEEQYTKTKVKILNEKLKSLKSLLSISMKASD